MKNPPSLIRHSELMTAMEPLLDLLGLTSRDIYLDPPLSIGQTVTFTVPESVADRFAGCNLQQRVVVGDGVFAERAITISIPIDVHLPARISK